MTRAPYSDVSPVDGTTTVYPSDNDEACQGDYEVMTSKHEPKDDGVEHARLHWTACYDDSCMVHLSAKDGAGYYPKKRASRKHRQPKN